MGIMNKIFTIINNSFKIHYEEKIVVKFLKRINLQENSVVLDVGCGYGRNMLLFQNNKLKGKIEGIEINKDVALINKKKGLCCYTVKEFKKIDKKYDCIIFSHIIEHFTPDKLIAFIEEYLSHLKKNGHVIIATPLLWKGFYKDFDHVKPYHPVGINMVFGNEYSQVQYYANLELKLVDIWFRKTSYMVDYKRGIYVKTPFSKWWLIINLFYKILFKCSFEIFGKTTGWIGLYKIM
jgi:SAM-dependent methyltransferase